MNKIAFPSDDGRTISRHFGSAPFMVVATVQEGQPVRLEQRQKAFHEHHDEPHGYHLHQHARFQDELFGAISDCQVLVSGGMGQPAYDGAVQRGLQVILTGESDIDSALAAYQAGKLASDPRRIHHHHPPSHPQVEI